jgi:radical SAM protein with 4Fe4S-binding SPASM domain
MADNPFTNQQSQFLSLEASRNESNMIKQNTRVKLTHLNLTLSEGKCLTCRHCWIQSNTVRDSGASPFMDSSTAFRAVEEALPLGLETVRLCGSTNLVYPHFDTLVNNLEELNVNIHLETNGSGLTSQRTDRLALLPKATVTIELLGADEATHDEAVGTPGSFATATQAINRLAEVGISPEIFFPVTRRGAGQLEPMVRLAERLGAGSIRFLLLQPEMYNGRCNGGQAVGSSAARGNGQVKAGANGHHTTPQPADLHISEMIALGRRIEREFAPATRLHLLIDQPPAFRGLHPGIRPEVQPRCGLLHTIGVQPDGDYALCSAGKSHPQLILGKVGLDPLSLIWNTHPMLRHLREGMPHRLEGICERCVMKTVCMGNCAAENYFRSGSFWSASWFCSAAEQAGLFPAGRLIENQR